ncbi:unnamed protein product [Arctia plantaginis]|uniref:Uncharacterized protein n=1 Tax=Arctia plantaginis TaxID=874455 RepID=A0A8S1A7V8_ARCPL|nr:unnamed protein product [Arctia plantaginis]
MATASLYHPYDTGDLSHEVGRDGAAQQEAAADAAALHERLVAYVHALAPPNEARSGVWVEHSYARARGASHAPSSHVRVLLAPRSELPTDVVDVERDDAPPPSPPSAPSSLSPRASREPSPDDVDVEVDEEWEARVTALAPSAAHAALAEHTLDTLRRMRLARLAGGRATESEHLRVAARRMRHALARAASAPGAAAPWLHATLLAYAPRAERRLYDALLCELARAAPRLAARLTGGRAPPPRRDPLASVGAALGPEGSGPWLVWVGAGGERQDRRWLRRLGALLHVRALAAPASGPSAPEAWCAAVASSMRTALADVLAEAGDRSVILGGFGAGASLCAALAANLAPPSVRGLVLLALPLLTAEGPRDSPDDLLAELRLPLLLVAGTGAGACPLGALRGLARARDPPHPPRRVLEVRGADDSLRLPAALRLRRRLPQHALDAAVAEECARWAQETAEGGGPRPARRRAAPDHEEYAHLPAAARAAPESARVVSRGSGATPLALLPPRRAPPPAPAAPPAPSPAAPPAPPALAAADIMRLPIVFADDEPPVTVTSGRYARVVLAPRARPLVLRRALRLVPRAARAPRAPRDPRAADR